MKVPIIFWFLSVIPAQAGIQSSFLTGKDVNVEVFFHLRGYIIMDSRLRGNDDFFFAPAK
jgi:membrane-bound acyltransferase YfiQ involved in biofilm formation